MATAEDRYIQEAAAAGCPSDQVRNFLRAGYVATPKQLAFHAVARQCDTDGGPVDILAGGARGGAKSHMIIAQIGLDDCQRAPGIKALFLRRTQRAAQESFSDLVSRVLRGIPHTMSQSGVEFPNGSRILIGGYHDPRDIEKYVGVEYDILAIEERTQLPGERIQQLKGSLRTSRSDWRPRTYSSTNPGGVGHADCKRDFVTPWRLGREGKTRYLPMTYRDNPFLDRTYIEYLEGLAGPLGKAWRDGDWDVFEGQAFIDWDDARHIKAGSIEIPPNWTRVRGIDWGYSAPFCCLWGAIDPAGGRVTVYRELYTNGLTDRQQAERIIHMTPANEAVSMSYADPSMWTKRTVTEVATSSADIYAQMGVWITPADNDRVIGKSKVHRLLADLPDGKPGLMVHESCYNLIRTLPLLVCSETKPEDIDTTQEDHAYDALRYMLTSIRDAKTENKRKRAKNPILGVRGI